MKIAIGLLGLITILVFFTTIYIEWFSHHLVHKTRNSDQIEGFTWSQYDQQTGRLGSLLKANFAKQIGHQWHLSKVSMHYYQKQHTWTIHSDTAVYNTDNQMIDLKGHIRLFEQRRILGDRILSGQHFTIDLDKRVIDSSAPVTLLENGQVIHAQSAHYDGNKTQNALTLSHAEAKIS